MENYVSAADKESKFQQAIQRARAALWAVSSSDATPAALKDEIAAKKQELKQINLNILKDGYRKPANETRFKTMVLKDERDVADLLLFMQDALDELVKVKKERPNQSKRWQVNYDFMLARVWSQYAYLYEYQSMLGQMRKELPPMDPNVHVGWKLAARDTLDGDPKGKKMATDAGKLYDQIITENANTPWEVLAKREQLTALGLEWKPSSK
jgi:hypothetical protein